MDSRRRAIFIFLIGSILAFKAADFAGVQLCVDESKHKDANTKITALMAQTAVSSNSCILACLRQTTPKPCKSVIYIQTNGVKRGMCKMYSESIKNNLVDSTSNLNEATYYELLDKCPGDASTAKDIKKTDAGNFKQRDMVDPATGAGTDGNSVGAGPDGTGAGAGPAPGPVDPGTGAGAGPAPGPVDPGTGAGGAGTGTGGHHGHHGAGGAGAGGTDVGPVPPPPGPVDAGAGAGGGGGGQYGGGGSYMKPQPQPSYQPPPQTYQPKPSGYLQPAFQNFYKQRNNAN